MTHHGGWPMTVFLTPEGLPFYAGTYFPPEDRYNMPGFPRVLISVADAYRERPTDVQETAASVLSELKRAAKALESNELLTTELLDAAFSGIVRSYDSTNGGFGGAPKFPPAMTLEFLLHTYYRTANQQALQIVEHTCRQMAQGGIYDQLGGGFHRYATDARWLVPHFEKMLYDNALLAALYLHYYQVSHDPAARAVAEGILDYVVHEMTHPGGGFYSTQDADSEGVEGKFFVWSKSEIAALLGEPDAAIFMGYYNVTDAGNFEGANILNIRKDLAAVAASHQVTEEQLAEALARSREILFAAREKRVKPARDEKILTAWNGLMLASFAEAAAILNRLDYLEVAKKNAQFLLDNLRGERRLLRTYKDGRAKLNAYLEDYAFFISGLVTLFETSGELKWLEEAVSLTTIMIDEFWDDEDGGFFYTGRSHENLIVRSKDFFDNATPSGNSVAAEVLLRLGLLTDNADFQRRAGTILRLMASTVQRYPSGFGRLLCALDFYVGSPKEIALVGDLAQAETHALLDELWSRYLPNKVVASISPRNTRAAELIPLLRERPQIDGKATVYLCEHFACQTPTTDPKELASQLLSSPAGAGLA